MSRYVDSSLWRLALWLLSNSSPCASLAVGFDTGYVPEMAGHAVAAGGQEAVRQHRGRGHLDGVRLQLMPYEQSGLIHLSSYCLVLMLASH